MLFLLMACGEVTTEPVAHVDEVEAKDPVGLGTADLENWPAIGAKTVRADPVYGTESAYKNATKSGLKAGDHPPDLSGTWKVEVDLGDTRLEMSVRRDRSPIPALYDVTNTTHQFQGDMAVSRTIVKSVEVIGPKMRCSYMLSSELSFATEAAQKAFDSTPSDLQVLNAKPCVPLKSVSRDRIEGEVVEERVAPGPLSQIEMCMHWAGEEPYDDERRAMIVKGVSESCPAAEKAVKDEYELLVSYPESAATLLNFLQHMGTEPADRKALCEAAATHWASEKASGESLFEPYFAAGCPEQAKRVCGKSLCQ